LRLQDDGIVTGCRNKSGTKALLTLNRIVEVPERREVNGHNGGYGSDERSSEEQWPTHANF
jgi:hypothetical protein